MRMAVQDLSLILAIAEEEEDSGIQQAREALESAKMMAIGQAMIDASPLGEEGEAAAYLEWALRVNHDTPEDERNRIHGEIRQRMIRELQNAG